MRVYDRELTCDIEADIIWEIVDGVFRHDKVL
jgi:hypothetical protein